MRTMKPMRALQVATTAAALLLAQAPAFAQAPPAAAPTAAPTVPPAPAPAPAPASTRAPAPDLPVEPEPLPPWTPSVEPPPTPAPTDVQAPPTDPNAPPPANVQSPLTDPNAPPPTPPADTVAPSPAPGPAPLTPVDLDKAKGLRRAGLGTMITGGVIALGSFATTLAFTIRGTRLEQDLISAEDNYQLGNCSSTDSSKCDGLKADRDQIRDGIISADRTARITGGILAGGLLITAIGGIVYRVGMKRLSNADNLSRVRVSPTFGGLMLSGRF